MTTAATLDPTKNVTEPTPKLLVEIENYKKEVDALKQTLARQNAILSSPEFLQRMSGTGTTTPAKNEPREIKTPQDFLQAIADKIEEITDQKLSTWAEQFTPLLREATKESPVWSKTAIAERLVNENPGLSMALAMELAEKRLGEEKARQETLQAEAKQLEAQKAREAASMGAKNNSSIENIDSSSSPRGRSLQEIFNSQWEKSGMDVATEQHQRETDDIWGPPKVPGIKPIVR